MSATLLSARSFRPTSLGGLSLWLDASVGSSLTLNGNTVSEWRDISGNARHYSQTTAAQQPDGTGRKQNGLVVLDFANGQALAGNTATKSIARNISGITMCIVGKLDSLAAPPVGGIRVFWLASNNLLASRAIVFYRETPSYFEAGGRRLDSDSFQSVSGAANLNPNVITGVLNYANSDAFIYGNGGLSGNNFGFQTDGSTSNTDSGATSIGAAVDASGAVTGNQLDGWIGEVVIYNRVLSSAERLTVERYLGAKWRIAVA